MFKTSWEVQSDKNVSWNRHFKLIFLCIATENHLNAGKFPQCLKIGDGIESFWADTILIAQTNYAYFSVYVIFYETFTHRKLPIVKSKFPTRIGKSIEIKEKQHNYSNRAHIITSDYEFSIDKIQHHISAHTLFHAFLLKKISYIRENMG